MPVTQAIRRWRPKDFKFKACLSWLPNKTLSQYRGLRMWINSSVFAWQGSQFSQLKNNVLLHNNNSSSKEIITPVLGEYWIH